MITFEGIEGCGKSTQVELLADALRQRGFPVLITCEPGGTEVGRWLREIVLGSPAPLPPMAELMIYLADRACHVDQVIAPALARGEVVICDRFSDSTLAYQSFGRGVDLGVVRSLDHQVTRGCRPDLTLLLDCPVAIGLQRVGERLKRDRLDSEGCDFHERVRAGFLELARQEKGRIRVIDATGRVEATQRRVLALVLAELGRA